MRTSVSLNDELTSYIEETASSAGENNAEAVREVVRHAKDLEKRVADLEATLDERDEEIATLEQRIEELEIERERLQNEKRQILKQREEHTELVRQVERERTLAERKAQAGLGQRIKWAVFGMDDEE